MNSVKTVSFVVFVAVFSLGGYLMLDTKELFSTRFFGSALLVVLGAYFIRRVLMKDKQH